MTTTKVETKTVPKTINKPAPVKKVPEQRLRDTDANNAWTVVVLEDCEWCNKAVELLKQHNETYAVKLLNNEWFRRLAVENEIRQVPAIFKGNAYFGNYAALENYYKGSFISVREQF